MARCEGTWARAGSARLRDEPLKEHNASALANLSQVVPMKDSQLPFDPQRGDALVAVDVQNDFLPGGNLAVPHGDAVVAPLNRYIATFVARGLPVYATRCWHHPDHCSFTARGGPWP